MVPVSLRFGQPFEHNHPHPFASHIAICFGRKGFAPSVFAKHACFIEADVVRRTHQGIHTAHHGHSAVSCLHSPYGAVHGDQGTGTGRFNRFTGPMQIQEIAHPVRSHRRHLPGGRIPFNCNLGLGDQFMVTRTACTHENACRAPGQALCRIAGILDGLPHICHQQPLLRVHQLCFSGRNTEEQGIKLIHPLHKTAPLDVSFVRFFLRVAVICTPVPPLGRDFPDAVDT
ncbi:hypothetical protein D3C74_290400 [compost metagenome]